MEYRELVIRALKKLPDSYVPYSHFHVAAALLSEDDTVFEGINIENASYTPTVCAERTAFFKAVSEGYRNFKAIAIVGCNEDALSSDKYKINLEIPAFTPPCGVCRQVMREFASPDEFEIILAKSPDDYKVYKLKELLPESFGPEFL
ncbi:MAG: cytidine deaminase [Eubacteriales bacterium]|nr:cytidine deaminase [Eubacteriales bacterium]